MHLNIAGVPWLLSARSILVLCLNIYYVSRLCSVVNIVRGCDYRSDIHCMQQRVMCGYVLEQVHNHTLSAAEDNAWLAN